MASPDERGRKANGRPPTRTGGAALALAIPTAMRQRSLPSPSTCLTLASEDLQVHQYPQAILHGDQRGTQNTTATRQKC